MSEVDLVGVGPAEGGSSLAIVFRIPSRIDYYSKIHAGMALIFGYRGL